MTEAEMHPTARKAGLVFTELAEETLVYDLERHRALCLNRMAAAVWHRCDGHASISELAAGVSIELAAAIDDEVIRFALKRLARAHLLDGGVASVESKPGISRREAMRKLAAAGVISIGLPTVLSVAAPTALQAQASCAGVAESCAVLSCCSGLFCNTATNLCLPL